MDNTYMTPNEVYAELERQGIHISRPTLYNHCTSGRLPSLKIGRKRFILRSDFINWLEGAKK